MRWQSIFLVVMLFLVACSAKQTTSAQLENQNNLIAQGQVGINLLKNQIIISNFAYTPHELKASKGDTITWYNADTAPHNIVSDSGSELNSLKLQKGETYSHTFLKEGVYEYHCDVHPTMKGKVIVE